MGAGFPTVAGGIEPLWEVRKDTDAVPPTRARTPAAANRLNRRELSGRRWTLARGMFSGMVSRRRGLGRRPGSARGGRTRRIRQPRPFLGKRRCSVLACCCGRHWLPDTAGVVPLLIGEAVGGGGDVVPELRRHMSCVVEDDEFAARPGLSQFPGGQERAAEIESAMDKHGRDAHKSMRIAQQLALIQPRTVPEVVGDGARESHPEAGVGEAGMGAATGVPRTTAASQSHQSRAACSRITSSGWASSRA